LFQSDPDCSSGYICTNQQCVEAPDPCDPNPCGPNAICTPQGISGSTCKCPSGFFGDARVKCTQVRSSQELIFIFIVHFLCYNFQYSFLNCFITTVKHLGRSAILFFEFFEFVEFFEAFNVLKCLFLIVVAFRVINYFVSPFYISNTI
jgi:hypothetical protein